MKKAKRYLIFSAVICALSVAAMFFALGMDKPQVHTEFTPPPFEENAEKGTPPVPKDLGWSELDARAFKFSVCGKVYAKEQKADVWFTNPKSNVLWLKLRILDENNNIIGETGIIRPGEYVRAVPLFKEVSDDMPITVKVMSYEPETYFSEGAVSLGTRIKVLP